MFLAGGEGVGSKCAPLGGPAAMVPDESYKSALWVVTIVFIIQSDGTRRNGALGQCEL